MLQLLSKLMNFSTLSSLNQVEAIFATELRIKGCPTAAKNWPKYKKNIPKSSKHFIPAPIKVNNPDMKI